jgi:hypothetical protein
LAEIFLDFRSSFDDFLEVLRTFFPRGPTPDWKASDVPIADHWCPEISSILKIFFQPFSDSLWCQNFEFDFAEFETLN